MAIDPAQFKIRFPEFASVDDARIQLFLDDAAGNMDLVVWGDRYDIGQSYLAAHYLAIASKSKSGNSGIASGPISSRTVDGVSVSYAGMPSTSQSEGYYNTTTYGARYYSMLHNLGVAAYAI